DATGAPATGLINLLQPGDVTGSIADNRGVPLSPGNPAMTPTLPPGNWVAVALVDKGKALAHVTLGSGEEASLTLTLSAGARVAGRVLFEGSSPRPAVTSIRLSARGAGIDAAAPPQGLYGG